MGYINLHLFHYEKRGFYDFLQYQSPTTLLLPQKAILLRSIIVSCGEMQYLPILPRREHAFSMYVCMLSVHSHMNPSP